MDQEILSTAFKMTIALGAVLLTFGIGVYLAKKFSLTSKGFLKKTTRDHAKPMEIMAYQSLGPGRGVYLIRCLNQKILVGATNANITSLGEIQDEEDEDLGLSSNQKNKSEDFARSLTERIKDDDNVSLSQSIKSSLKNISRV